MTNREAAQRYANGATSGGSNNIFIGGDAIYSYGTHFPLAVRVRKDEYMINRDKYSVTTSHHQTLVFGQLSFTGARLIDSNTAELKSKIREIN